MIYLQKRKPVLRFFRLNDPYRLLGVLLMMIIIGLPMLTSPEALLQEFKDIVLGEALNDGKTMYLQVLDDTPWLAAWFAKWIGFIFGRSVTARHILALFFLFFQSAFFCLILIRNKAYNENNYLPGLIFGILCFFSFDLISLSHELLASTLLLLALNNLFKEIEFKVQLDETVLNLGVYLGIASMLVFSYTLFLLGTIMILAIFARITFRKSMLLLFGFVFPHSLLLCYYYFHDGLPAIANYFYDANFTIHTVDLITWKSLLPLGSALLIFLFFSIIMLGREARFTKYQSQLMQVMLLWMLLAIAEIFFTRERTPHSFITFIPPLTYFISHYLLLIRRKWISETMLWILLLSVIGISTASRLGKLNSVSYSSMKVKKSAFSQSIENKRVLILADDFGLYENNKMSSYFLNWHFAKHIFEHPEFYENIVLINSSFQKDLPDVIIDENGLMEKVFPRLPQFKKQFYQKGKTYERIR